jgi:hypothetical protein
MIRILLKDYNPIHISETAVIHQFHFFIPNLLNFQNSFEAAVKLLDESTIRYIPFRVARNTDYILKEITNNELES